ncbi:hypothetical protein K439DRAFT_1302795, partial [Ramaria rubella]
IALGRHVVSGVWASGQWREDFEAVISHGHTCGDWEEQLQLRKVGGNVIVPQLQLLCDVDTHWDSVYYM